MWGKNQLKHLLSAQIPSGGLGEGFSCVDTYGQHRATTALEKGQSLLQIV